MRKAFWALVLCGAVPIAGTTPVAAQNYPFCIKGCDFGDTTIGDCSFSTYQQCQATASGRTATCAPNPYFNARAEMQAGRGRYSARKF
jgi:hypothetical protein